MSPKAKRSSVGADAQDEYRSGPSPKKGRMNDSRASTTNNRPENSDSEVPPQSMGPVDGASGGSTQSLRRTVLYGERAETFPSTGNGANTADGPTVPARRSRPTLPEVDYHPRAEPTPVKNAHTHIIVPSGSGGSSGTQAKILHAVRAFKKADKSKYRYQDIREDQCRLLYLKPGKEDEDINATLIVVDDDQLPECHYEALSYHWGTGEAVNTILINEDYNAAPIAHMADAVLGLITAEGMKERRMYVRPNLCEALKGLRQPNRPIYLWVDALCIWQDNNEEKTVQVMKMATIYRNARNVCIWLGSSDETSDRAMSFIKKVIDMDTLKELLDGKHMFKWKSLFQLLRWSWFSRRWVIQELALAKRATVHCGKVEVNWNDFKDAISIFQKYFKTLKPKLENPKLSSIGENQEPPISDIEPLGAKLLVDLTSNLFRTKPDNSVESTYGLEMLVSMLAGFDTSDPRDTINSVRNICRELNDGNPLDVPDPDYSKNLLEIYSEFVEWVISNAVDSSKSLDILCRYWALPEKESQDDKGPTAAKELVTLPSWISTVDKGLYGRGAKVFEGRKAGEPFVGMPGRSQYDASAKRKVDFKFEKTKTTAALTVKGLLIGKIEWCSEPIPDGVVTRGCLEKLGWNQPAKARAVSEAPPPLWRTLVADRGPRGEPVPSYYHRACLYCLVNQTANGHINTKELLRSGKMNDFVQKYLERVQAVTWNRVILHANRPEGTKNTDELVGLGPPETKQKDVVAILFGCSVPVILRPHDSKNGKPGWYEFIGEAYIYGKMDGEAMFGDYHEESFRLQ